MTLLEDITKERKELAEEVNEFAEDLLLQASRSIRNSGHFSPVVVAIIGPTYKVFGVEWRSPHERDKTFARLNETLQEYNVTGSVLVMPGEWGGKPAIVVQRRTPSEHDMTAFPYDYDQLGNVEWGRPKHLRPEKDDLLAVPTLN